MSILFTYYSEPMLLLFLDYSTHKVHLLRFTSVFFVLKGKIKYLFLITVHDLYIRV